MCGIAGYFSNNTSVDVPVFEKALDRLRHRGPDHGAVKELPHGILGHRRLSIIDLSTEANQPFTLSAQPNLTMVYNGEVYNYKELGNGLQNLITNSDTEVILQGYNENGISFFKSLRGIYAFAIADYRKSSRVILYRDPSGIKPLYYYLKNGQFIFASEIKAIVPLVKDPLEIHDAVIKAYLSVGYCPEPYTVYQDIKAVVPGTLLELDLNSFTLSSQTLNGYDFKEHSQYYNEVDIRNSVSGLLKQSVKRNVVSDVPLLFSLSGGIDSSLIVAFSKDNGYQPETLTVSFNDKDYNESEVAQIFADRLNVKANFTTCDTTGSLDLLKKLLLHFDQPYADSSFIPFYFLSREAARHGKVLVGGDGGDEIHAGYSNFVTVPRIRRLKILQPFFALATHVLKGNYKRLLKKINVLLSSKSDEELIYLRESWIYPSLKLNGEKPFTFDFREGVALYSSCFPTNVDDSFSLKFSNDVFYRRMVSDYLRKTDMMSMLNSIEYRVPMLDEDLVQFSLGIPLKYKIHHDKGKKILRELHSQFFPQETTSRPKTGFSIPLDTWLSKADFDEIENYLLQDGILNKYVNSKYIQSLFKALHNNAYASSISRAGAYQQILIFYSLQLWFNEGRN